jgi:hypothetical protein
MVMRSENAKYVGSNVSLMEYIEDIENDVHMLVWENTNMKLVMSHEHVLYVEIRLKFIKIEKRLHVRPNVYLNLIVQMKLQKNG